MKMDGWVRIGTMIDLDGLKKGLGKVKNTLSSVVGGLAKSLGGALSVLLVGAVATGIYILNKALEKANGESGQLKTNLSYIGFVGSKVFENLLTPAIDKTTGAVNGLVGALYKVVVYIGYILSEWTGKDLFEGTSVEDYQRAMEKAEKNAKGTAKSTAKIKKDLMSFDEVNKLSDNTSGGGSSGGGMTLPNLPNLGDVPIPGWVKWIGDHKDDILKIATAIGGMFLIIKGLDLAQKLSPLLQLFGFGGGGATGKGLLGTLFGGGAITTAIGVGAIASIIADIVIWRDTQKQIVKDQDKVNANGRKINENYVESKVALNDIDSLYRGINVKQSNYNDLAQYSGNHYKKTMKENLNQQGTYIDGLIEIYKKGKMNNVQQENLKTTLLSQIDYLDKEKEVYRALGYDISDINKMQRNYKDTLREMGVDLWVNKQTLDETRAIQELLQKENKMGTQENIEWARKKLGLDKEEINYSEIKNIKLKEQNSTMGDIINSISQTINKQTEEFNNQKRIKDMVDSVLQTTKAINDVDLKDKAFKVKVDKTALTEMIKTLPNKINLGLGMSFDLTKVKKAFGLAQGGIINVPGRGVPLGNGLIGGESGREAVIPLNDETMDRLGSSIAKHMSVNLTNINQMNGRVISRELKQISNENDFSYNG